MISVEVLAEVRALIAERGASALVVDDFTSADLEAIASWNSPSHLRSMAEALTRVERGEIDYLAVRAPGGPPVAKGGVDYCEHLRPHKGRDGLVDYPVAGTLWQLSTHGDLWGLGLMTTLMVEAERRIVARGLDLAVLGVELDNARARRLYDHMGYSPFGRVDTGWDHEHPDGTIERYDTEIIVMRKTLDI